MQPKRKMAYRLNKTSYLKYLKCPPEFWLDFHQALLTAEEITLEHEHLRQQGYSVEQLVKEWSRFWTTEEKLVEFQRTFNTADYQARCDVVVTNRQTGTIE